jgi:RNA 2',3'-cyclic 3'-phosphodiesterase
VSRLFAAVTGSAAAYDAIEQVLPAAGTPGAPRWSDRSLWHVTVAFIGEYAAPAPLLPGLAGAARTVEPFELSFRGSGKFPDRGAPRVLWAGVAGDLDALHALATGARDAVAGAGASPDQRPYRPHLTLGLWRPGAPADRDCAPGLADLAGPPFTVTELILYASHGTWYDRLAAWPLGPVSKSASIRAASRL